ncbi:MAG: hypothetical protein ACJ73S_18160 [Mycobacteriales bacterium]
MERAEEIQSTVVDLTQVSLETLRHYDSATLAPTMDRLLSHIDNPQYSIGGYNPQRID